MVKMETLWAHFIYIVRIGKKGGKNAKKVKGFLSLFGIIKKIKERMCVFYPLSQKTRFKC